MASSKNVGSNQCTALSSAVSLATAYGSSIPTTADYCTIQAEAQAIRWRDDSTNPTAGVGNVLAAGDTLIVRKGQFTRLRLIEATASAKAMICFYKTG